MTTILFFVLMAMLVNALALVFLYLKHNKKHFFNRKPTIVPDIPQKENFNEIIGKSQTVLCQEKPSEANQRQIYKPINEDVTFVSSKSNNRSAIVDESEFPTIFSETPTPIHLDIEMEYEVLIEEDEIICYSGEILENAATGIDVEEMNNLVQVINQKTDKPEQEQQACATIMKIGQTDLFEQMLSQIELGHVRVEMMLNKYETKTSSMLSPNSIDDDFENFELNSYL
jgi:hypothetical protein